MIPQAKVLSFQTLADVKYHLETKYLAELDTFIIDQLKVYRLDD